MSILEAAPEPLIAAADESDAIAALHAAFAAQRTAFAADRDALDRRCARERLTALIGMMVIEPRTHQRGGVPKTSGRIRCPHRTSSRFLASSAARNTSSNTSRSG